MILIVGLGNPGKKFEKTRHNLGFRIIDEFARKNNFPNSKLKKRFLAEISEGEIGNEKIILTKPQTFMNNSGKAVKFLNSKFKILNSKLWIIHDDIDLPLGELKIVKNRGSAGHKGVQSIIEKLGTKNFVRFRIGIKPVTGNKQQATRLEKIVLQKFNKEEKEVLKEVIEKTCQAIEMAIKEGIEKTMNEFNQ